LFLDEVGELPLASQVKLLRLLQAHEYTPVGESRAIKSTARIVAATNRDLAREVAAGRFREDLYYRLNVIHVKLPALRERRDDIPLLAQHFLALAAERSGRPEVVAFAPEVLERIAMDEWPGNIRALENVVERAVLLATGPTIEEIDGLSEAARPVTFRPRVVASAPAEPVAPAPFERVTEREPDAAAAMIDLRAAVEAYENELISGALLRAGNNRTKAAQLLGLQRTPLVEMLKRKRLDAVPRAA
jgi:sigma-54 specific flagellar transcriptional regulator A